MKPQIFVDMDGVLSNFFDAALAAHGSDGSGYPRGLYQIEQYLDITANEFWRVIDEQGEDFWSGMSMCEGADALWELVLPHKPIILTSPSMNPLCLSGKLKWMQNVFHEKFRDYIFCPAQHKHLLANHKNSILIDDRQSNVDDWHKAGGIGVLWPHIGNEHEGNVDSTIENLKPILEEIY